MAVSNAPTALHVARARARKWLRIFQQLVRVLDRLEQQEPSLLARALVFLVQRALGQLESGEAVAAIGAPARSLEAGGEETSGDELLAAVDLARPSRERRDARSDPSCDELEVLLVLAGALTESDEAGAFGDAAVTCDALLREYRSLQGLTADDVLRVPLFPLAFRRRWSALLRAAATKDDPMRRLALELSIMKVIHALYALAVGFRSAPRFQRSEPAGDAWFAWGLGESLLKSTRR